MSREDIEKLLGGHATGTLTPQEREALFAAALEDQELFDTLAREEPLRELLQDPAAKARLVAALEEAPAPWHKRWLRPAVWAVPAAALAAIVVVLIVQRPASRQPVTIAEVQPLRRLEPVAPVPSPLPQALEKPALPPPARSVELKDVSPAPLSAAAVPAPPAPPPPAAAPPPAEPVQVAGALDRPEVAQPRQAQAGQQSAAGARLEATSGRFALGGGVATPSDARSLFFGAPIFQSNLVAGRAGAPGPVAQAVDVVRPAVTNLGLRYSIVKRLADGQLSAVNPNEPLEAADEIALQLEPNDSGYLSVFEHASNGAWPLLLAMRVERMASYTVPQDGTLRLGDSERKELFVVLSRQPQRTSYPVPEARLDQLTGISLPERSTYVVSISTAVTAQTIAFPITLRHR